MAFVLKVFQTSTSHSDGGSSPVHGGTNVGNSYQFEMHIQLVQGGPRIQLCHLSHEKNPPTFHCTGLLIGILIMVYYSPYITG